MRLFVAISFTPEAWIKPENIHLTLKCLGSTPKIPQMEALAKTIYRDFVLTLSNTIVFPNFKKPRILSAGLQMPCDPLARLEKNIEEHLAPLGFAPEPRPFSPNLTLARLKSGKNIDFLAQTLKAIFHIASVKVKSVQLYQSQLTREGVTYTVLETFVLTNGLHSRTEID